MKVKLSYPWRGNRAVAIVDVTQSLARRLQRQGIGLPYMELEPEPITRKQAVREAADKRRKAQRQAAVDEEATPEENETESDEKEEES